MNQTADAIKTSTATAVISSRSALMAAPVNPEIARPITLAGNGPETSTYAV